MKYRVLLPTAGLGSRLGNLSKNINKALIAIGHKPAISHIVEKFDKKIEFVVPVGYKADTVKDYLTLAYPDRKFYFIDIDKYEGQGSGLGYTILKCRHLLQLPFIFISNDTLVLEPINAPLSNWVGYSPKENISQYRSLVIEQGFVSEICAKGSHADENAYIGLAGIFDYDIFWKAMEQGVGSGLLEIGESHGLRALISKDVKAIRYSWYDTGNIDALQQARSYYNKDTDVNILDKEDEAIWFLEKKVIKFSTDVEFIKNRVKRSTSLKSYIPKIIDSRTNMYAYEHVEGEIFSKTPSINNFRCFLDWMKSFWLKSDLTSTQNNEFLDICTRFYKEKTYNRVKLFFSKFEQLDTCEYINGIQIPKVEVLLDLIDWNYVSEGIPVRFHGDLHFENILINNGAGAPFILLDWRQDFGGLLEYGDLYYDLGKLYHGIIISHEIIHKNLYKISQRINHVNYDFLRKQSLVDCEEYFRQWLKGIGLDVEKVTLICGLIFLNIAALHHYPYSSLLFHLGKRMIFDVIDNEKIIGAETELMTES